MRFFNKSILYSNAKLLNLYFVGTFLVLLLIVFIQQSWFKVSESEVFEKYFVEKTEELPEVSEEDIIEKNQEIPGIVKNEFVITEGDNLASIFKEAKISNEHSYKIIKEIRKVYNPRKLKIGNTIFVDFDPIQNSEFVKPKLIKIRTSNIKEIEIKLLENGVFKAVLKDIPLIKHYVRLTGEINNSFIASAAKLAIPHHAIMAIVKAYSYDVDFQRDIKKGNKLDLLIDKYYTSDGKFSHISGVVYAKLTLHDRNVEIFRFADKDNDLHYYNKDALCVRKQLLRTPINAARISSRFGMRKHPVLGYSRMHKGVDFAAPIGSPILAAGKGVVQIVARKGGYGKYIRIKHSNEYSTAYAHLSRYAKNIAKGTKVKQGQVIGYVGMTGVTSGPHLHYEVLQNGKQINPQKLKLAPQEKLTGKELQEFNKHKTEIINLLAKLSPSAETTG